MPYRQPYGDIYSTVSQKNYADLFLSELRQICTNFDNFWQKDGNDPNISEVHSFATLPNLRHHLTVLNANVPNCYITRKLLVIDRSHWPPNSPDLNPVDYSIWSVLQEKVYRSKIADIDELKTRLVNEWGQFDQSITDTAISQWRRRLSACVRARGAHFENKF